MLWLLKSTQRTHRCRVPICHRRPARARPILYHIVLALVLLLNSATLSAEMKAIQIHSALKPPFSFTTQNSNTAEGLWIEIVQHLLRDMTIPYEAIKNVPMARLKFMATENSVDAIIGVRPDDNLRQHMWVPREPLTTDPWVLWIRRSDMKRLKFESLNDLKGHPVGIVRGYAYPKYFLDFLHQEKILDTVTRDEQNFTKLMLGRIDFVASQLHVGNYFARKAKIRKEVIPLIEKPLSNTSFYIVFNKKRFDQKFVDTFASKLIQFKLSRTYRNIVKKYGFIILDINFGIY